MIIKIGGITTVADAWAAIDAGADMLSFNLNPTHRHTLSLPECAAIAANLRTRRRERPLTLVGVFADWPVEQVLHALDSCYLDLAQMAGQEPSETLAALGERGVKWLRPLNETDLHASMDLYPLRQTPPAWIIDANPPGQSGNTGRDITWRAVRRVSLQAPIVLAGGLNLENIAAAIEVVRPWGVESVHGVESTPGRKDPRKLVAFVKTVQAAVAGLADD